MELLRLRDLVRVRPVPVRPRDLEYRGKSLQPRVAQEHRELLSEQAILHVGVPVAVRPERCGRVVYVQRTQAVEPDLPVELVEDRVERGRVGHVATRRVQVARVQTDTEARMPVEPIEDDGKLLDGPADRSTRPGRVLHQQPCRVRAPVEDDTQRRDHPVEARVHAGAEMRPDVEHDAVGIDRAPHVHRVRQRRHRLLVEVVLRRGQVDQIERVAQHAAERRRRALLLEALEVRGRMVRRPPHARALREDLHRVGAHLHGSLDRRVDAACRRHVSPDEHGSYDTDAMPPVVRFAPSPTGFLHIGGVHTALFNWLFARHENGEFRLRIENTDTSREVAEATDQIQESLRWLGLDWDGELTFQLDRMDRCREEAQRLLDEGRAYEDERAIRIRMPDEGTTAWDDLIRGRIDYPNEKIEDVVIVRADGRPTYNFASPVEDWLDGITHVLRGDDHISNTPKQIQILQALGAPLPEYGHLANILGPDGKKLSKRHGATSVEEFRAQGHIPEALVNFLALLGWSYDDKTTVMSRDELVERFTLDRVGASPAVFDFQKLEWLNGVYLRELAVDEYADRVAAYLRGQGLDWDGELVRRSAPLVQEKIATLGEYPDFAGFLFGDVDPDPALLDGPVLEEAEPALADAEPFTAETIESRLRELAERLGLKPREAFQPIRVAVTGSKVSPGLFESIELLGKEQTLGRLRRARQAAA